MAEYILICLARDLLVWPNKYKSDLVYVMSALMPWGGGILKDWVWWPGNRSFCQGKYNLYAHVFILPMRQLLEKL